MTMVVSVGFKNEVRIASDTRLTLGKDKHADVGSKLYRLNNRAAIGMAGIGAYAHHLMGDVLSHIDYKETPANEIFSELKRDGIDKKILALADLEKTLANQITFLLSGFDKSWKRYLSILRVNKDFELVESKVPTAKFAGHDYELAVIGTGVFFEPDVKQEVERNIQVYADAFPSGYTTIMRYVIRSQFSTVGGLLREMSIAPGMGVRVWHDMGKGSIASRAGRGFRGKDFMHSFGGGGTYGHRMIDLIAYLEETKNGNSQWFDELRQRRVKDQTLLTLIPSFGKKLATWHPEHEKHQEIIDLFISDATKNSK